MKVLSISEITELTIVVSLDIHNSKNTNSFGFVRYVVTNLMELPFCAYLQKYLYTTDCEDFSENISEHDSVFGYRLALTPYGFKN